MLSALIYTRLKSLVPAPRLIYAELLAKYSSFRLGGPADVLYKAKTRQELKNIIIFASINKIPFIILGGGTNILVGDKGFPGLVIKNETTDIRLIAIKGVKRGNGKNKQDVKKVYLECDSGVSVNRLVRYALSQSYSGLEAFLGQPGTIGGAVWINAHNMMMNAFFSDCLKSVKLIKTDNTIIDEPKNYFNFAYDECQIQITREVVLSVIIELTLADQATLWQSAHRSLTYRGNTQPKGIYSAGCIFRNIDKSDALRLKTPNYTCSAGFILESLGLKGKKIGNAFFSPQHANFIVHKGDATAYDVIQLINLAKAKALEKNNLVLREEIKTIGEF